MARTVTLDAGNGYVLELNADGNDWCRCSLRKGDDMRDLGAEDARRVVERLAQALKPNPTQREKGELAWVISLSEPHTSIYQRVSADRRYLIVEDDQAHVVAELVLGPDSVERWLRGLEQLLNAD
jgi:hypothetical protein